MSRKEKYAEAERQFDSLDYNNQRNLLLFIKSNAIYIRRDGAPDTCRQCPYHKDYSFVCDIVMERGISRIRKMIDLLTRARRKISLKELMERAA